ncbi:MAG TPA: hypothetical protein VKQ52_08370 [Puia sp.]|nr:hypothetical protein [Puia sp.]
MNIRIGILLIFLLFGWSFRTEAQSVYTIQADSVKLTGCDSSELIIGNHTQNIPGFLFNTGNGRTIFKRGAQLLGNGYYLIGADTLKLNPNAWVQGGNSFGSTGVLGTLDNNHLDLYTNNVARARLSNTGHFLIGTTADDTASYLLRVKGGGIMMDGGPFYKKYYTDRLQASLKIGSGYELYGVDHASGGYVLYISGGLDGSFDAGWQLAFGNNNNQIMVLSDSLITTNRRLLIAGGLDMLEQYSYRSSPYVGFQYESHDGWDWAVVNSDGNPNLVVTYAGNTLVGATADNGNKLQVGGNSYLNGNSILTGNVRLSGLTSDTTQTRVLVSDAGGNLYYRDASTLAAGEVLRSSLAVNGPITAKKLRLTAKDWPDYVFNSGYRLPPLAGVESYIRQQHHLPGFPSAGEVEKNGVDVGSTQAALVKKIEELILYNIAQEKRLTEQDKRMGAQEKEIGLLKEEIDALKRLVIKQP